MFFIFLILVLLTLGIFLKIQNRNKNRLIKYYVDQGFPLLQSKLSSWQVLTGKGNVSDFDVEYYTKLGQLGQDIGIVAELGAPVLILRNLDMAKDIFIKDFDSFPERRGLGIFGKILDQGLFHLKGQEWRDMRNLLSPTFSSGKIKNMYSHFERSAYNLKQHIATFSENSFVIPITDTMQRFTLQVISSAAFGLNVNTFEDQGQAMLSRAQMISTFTLRKIAKLVTTQQFPGFSNFFGITASTPEVVNYFWALISAALDSRMVDGGVKQNDFLQILVDFMADKGWSKDVAIPQAFTFIAAGFDTVSSNLAVACYVLATRGDMQDKLYGEVSQAMPKGLISYDDINQLEYLDMFLSEVLRLYPPNSRLDRLCGRDYRIPGTNKIIKKGTLVVIPTDAFHKDPHHYPDPMTFDPAHFNKESKAKRNPYAYMPFGIGPRNCIGMRFAIMETKVALAHIVTNFIVRPTSDTPVPMRIQKGVLGYKVSPDINLHLIPRS